MEKQQFIDQKWLEENLNRYGDYWEPEMDTRTTRVTCAIRIIDSETLGVKFDPMAYNNEVRVKINTIERLEMLYKSLFGLEYDIYKQPSEMRCKKSEIIAPAGKIIIKPMTSRP